MPHIALPAMPGIVGLMQYRQDTGHALSVLAETLLRGDSPLSRGERELIAAHVSKGNGCHFCHRSHAAFAAAQLDGGEAFVTNTLSDVAASSLSPKMKALLEIAGHVRELGTKVTEADIATARAAGASDRELHDTVLIAAAFCMYNRYVDGLGTFAPPEGEAYREMAARIVSDGYVAAGPA